MVGCNMSFFKSLKVNQENNNLFWINEHFYSTHINQLYKNKYDLDRSKIHIELLKHTSSFYLLFSMSKFFNKNKIHVRNLTNNSYLDCFDRK